MSEPAPYRDFTAFKADRPHDGVLRLWIDTGAPNNGITHDNHREFGDVWTAVAAEEDVRVVLVRGTDGIFCGGGDISFLEPLVDSPARRAAVYEDIRALALNMLDCPKPIVTAIDGVCSGGGLAVAVMGDVSIASRSATLIDAHIVVGLACGDHAAFAWPLLMGMARAKYHLLTATALSGDDAAQAGLVSFAVDDTDLPDQSLEVAKTLASLPPEAVSQTKRALNGWYRMAQPILEQAAAMEALGFAGEHVRSIVASRNAGAAS
jgi:enoyl-CoA hydratase